MKRAEDGYCWVHLSNVVIKISEIVSEAGTRLQKEGSDTSKFPYQWTTHRAFKHVAGLFAFRILSRALENPPFFAPTIVKALPSPTHTPLDLLMMDFDSGDAINDSTNVSSAITSQFGRIEWNSTQPILGASLLTLKEKGYINNIPNYSLIKSVFTNAQSIDQSMRPGKEDGETQYEKIKANAFGLFKTIKPNPKLPNGKKIPFKIKKLRTIFVTSSVTRYCFWAPCSITFGLVSHRLCHATYPHLPLPRRLPAGNPRRS